MADAFVDDEEVGLALERMAKGEWKLRLDVIDTVLRRVIDWMRRARETVDMICE
jgi:hypothetical protein